MIRAAATERVSPAERQSLHQEALRQLRGELIRHLGANPEGVHVGVHLASGGGTALAVRAGTEELAATLRAALPEKFNGFPVEVDVASGEQVPLASEARQIVREQTAALSLSKVYQRRIDRALVPDFAEAWPGGSGIRGQYVDNDWQLFLGEGPRVSHVGSRTLQDGRFYDYKTGGNGTEAWGTVTTASASGAVISQVREHRGDVNQIEAVVVRKEVKDGELAQVHARYKAGDVQGNRVDLKFKIVPSEGGRAAMDRMSPNDLADMLLGRARVAVVEHVQRQRGDKS
jgi:hypothetical protein